MSIDFSVGEIGGMTIFLVRSKHDDSSPCAVRSIPFPNPEIEFHI
jgi:hypothetical protein